MKRKVKRFAFPREQIWILKTISKILSEHFQGYKIVSMEVPNEDSLSYTETPIVSITGVKKMDVKEKILNEMMATLNPQEVKMQNEIMGALIRNGVKKKYQCMTDEELRKKIEELIIKYREC